MKLAEALLLRADAQKRIDQLCARLKRMAQVQEGDNPPEDPQKLFNELEGIFAQLEKLIQQINRTNANTPFAEGMMLTDALAQRDLLLLRRSTLQTILNEASGVQHRYGRAEIRYVVTVDVRQLQAQIDDLSRQHRLLDTAIQRLNWTVDVLE